VRKVYTTSDATGTFSAIEDFMGMLSSYYTLIDSANDRRVYHNINEGLDLIFFNYSTFIILLVTTEYNSSVDPFYQKDIITCYGKRNTRVDANAYYTSEVHYMYAPVIFIHGKFVMNFNTENVTVMISNITTSTMAYECGNHSAHRTHSMFFSSTKKYLDFPGGFMYGGDFVYTFEQIYRIYHWRPSSGPDRTWRLTPLPRQQYFCADSSLCDTSLSHHVNESGDWVTDPYSYIKMWFSGGEKISPHRCNRFECFMRADIDNSPNRHTDDVIRFDHSSAPTVTRSRRWAVTPEISYYVRMVASITMSSVALPRYKYFMSRELQEKGQTVNTLNNISPMMPLWLMVVRDPAVLSEYSAACRNDVINFVNMYNMDTDRIEQGSYPTIDSYKYNCFQMGNRRSLFGMKGYAGIGFRMEEDAEPSPEPVELDLLDLDAMQAHVDTSDPSNEPILNIDVDGQGRKGYGGDTTFTDLPTGSFILKAPFTNYTSLTFEFTDDGGSVTDTVTWTKADLLTALNGSSDFNLLPANSPVTWGGSAGEWDIKPYSAGSTDTVFLCSFQNCGMIGAHGNT